MQDVELFTPGLEHTAELGRICFEAFRQVSEGHGFERDFPDAETAAKVIGLIQGLPGSFQVAARADGRLAGSNFMHDSDDARSLRRAVTGVAALDRVLKPLQNDLVGPVDIAESSARISLA